MHNIKHIILNQIFLLYDGTLINTIVLALALTLNGYEIKINWRKVLTSAVIITVLSSITFHFPQSVRMTLNVLIIFVVIKWVYSLKTGRSFLITITFLSVHMVSVGIPVLILINGMKISFADYSASPLLRLLFPLVVSIPLVIITYVSYRKRWLIFSGFPHLKVPVAPGVSLTVQLVLIIIASHEYAFMARSSQDIRNLDGFLAAILFFAMVLNIFFLWRVFRVAEREAIVSAHEQLAQEMQQRINIIRAQRHDFVNHIQVITALLLDGQLQALAQYMEEIKQDLNIR